jgi:hypothetical protein
MSADGPISAASHPGPWGLQTAEMEMTDGSPDKYKISIQDRFECGNFDVAEICILKKRSRAGFYADLKAGLVQVKKQGRRTVVPGPVAKQYIAGEPIAA